MLSVWRGDRSSSCQAARAREDGRDAPVFKPKFGGASATAVACAMPWDDAAREGVDHCFRRFYDRLLPGDKTCPISTEGWTRRVHFVREGGGGGAGLLPAAPRGAAAPILQEGDGAATVASFKVLARSLRRRVASANIKHQL